MTGAAILGSLGDIPSGPADFLMFRFETRATPGATLTGTEKIKIKFGCLCLNINNTGKVKTDSLILREVKNSWTY